MAKSHFVIGFRVYCPKCQLLDIFKIGSGGWQGGTLPEEYLGGIRRLAGQHCTKALILDQ